MKKLMKKLTVAALSMALSTAVAAVPLIANASFLSPEVSYEEWEEINSLQGEHRITEDGLFKYRIGRDPHLCSAINDYFGEGGDIVVPDIAGKLRVTIANIYVWGRDDVTSVTFAGVPDFIYIGGNFSNCKNLESFTVNGGMSDEFMSVYFPYGLTDTYRNSINLRSLAYDENNKKLEKVIGIFENCTNLKYVNLPFAFPSSYSSTSVIDNYTFKNCTALPEIVLEGSWEIKEGAFLGCTSLEKVVFSKEIFNIEDYALGYVENEDGTYSRYDGLTIYGVEGTVAETYALENDIPFIPVEPKETPVVTTVARLTTTEPPQTTTTITTPRYTNTTTVTETSDTETDPVTIETTVLTTEATENTTENTTTTVIEETTETFTEETTVTTDAYIEEITEFITSAEVSDTTTTTTESVEELPQTGYPKFFNWIIAGASIIIAGGSTVIIKSRKKYD